MITLDALGDTATIRTAPIERGRLQLFAKATGQTDPLYVDPFAARELGHPDIAVPPSFLFGLAMEDSAIFPTLVKAGLDLRRVLHGEQSFLYHRMLHAGDVIRISQRVTECYEKNGGALDFVVVDSDVTETSSDECAAELRTVLIVRNPGGSR